MALLATRIEAVQSACKDPTVLGSFMENHDNPRFPNKTTDIVLAANAIAFTMLADGIPIIYYGQDQHDMGGQDPRDRVALWDYEYDQNATLYTLITQLNAIRSNAISVDSGYLDSLLQVIHTDPNTLVTRKGPDSAAILGVFSDLGTANATDYVYFRSQWRILWLRAGSDAGGSADLHEYHCWSEWRRAGGDEWW